MRGRMTPWNSSPENAAYIKYLVINCPWRDDVFADLVYLLTTEFVQRMTRLRAVCFGSFSAPARLISDLLDLPSLRVWENGDTFKMWGDPAGIRFNPQTLGITHVRMDLSGEFSDADLKAITKITHSPRLRTLQLSNSDSEDDSLFTYLQDPPSFSFKALTQLTCRLPTDLGLLHHFVSQSPNITHLEIRQSESPNDPPPLLPCPTNALQQLRTLTCPIEIAGAFTLGRPIEHLKLDCNVVSEDVIRSALRGSSSHLKHVEFDFHYSMLMNGLCGLECIADVVPTLERLMIKSHYASRARVS